MHTYKDRHIQPSSESNIRFIVVEMIKHHSHPPGSRGFSEIQQHTHPVVKFDTLEFGFVAVGFLYFLKIWLSQAQFSDMKTQQGWKNCVIKYK